MPHVEEQIVTYAHNHGAIPPGGKEAHSLVPRLTTGLTINQLIDIRKAAPGMGGVFRAFCPTFTSLVGVSILFDDGDPVLEITNNTDETLDVTGGTVEIIIQRVCNV